MKVRSFAKINLGIEVLKKRRDGYHEIKTLFQTIDLSDTLEFRLLNGREVRLSGTDSTIPWDESNLVFRAARLLQQSFPNAAGVEIRVTKNIPAGRGLGGGSSNAALALVALNNLWRIGLDRPGLQTFARRLGADVPYFLEGGLCLGEGRGDELSPLDDLPVLHCALALPSFPISTADIYGRLRLTSLDKDSKINRFLARREFGLLENRLEETIFSLYPRLKAIRSSFLQKEAVLSLVSGTGSAVFGLFEERDKAARALAAMESSEPVLLVETLPRGRYWKRTTAGV
ncbi:MAG: 4-(cytidine 5'-diphospho)-2-C-methyl-D-erythritol kinase [Candidatus Aminicenantes bacterium]|nr:4-(cytidine 5'-diphospho)-2-C-methyl-D-erythritol kinase [Candidatus Aminicenantes bacterium]